MVSIIGRIRSNAAGARIVDGVTTFDRPERPILSCAIDTVDSFANLFRNIRYDVRDFRAELKSSLALTRRQLSEKDE